jgi:putative ABC transport system permease protein
VKRQVADLDSKLPVFQIESMEDHVRTAQLAPRMGALLFGMFGAIGLLLAAVGLYGVVAYSVSRRIREIGVRIALGADATNVRWLVVRQAMGMTLIGTIVGLALASGLARIVANFLYGVSQSDWHTFAEAALTLIMVAALASYLPARCATEVDPLVALRHE